jgi:hypothetical protein
MDLYNSRIVPVATMYFLTLCRYYGCAKDFLSNIYATNKIVKVVTDKTYLTTMSLYWFLIGQKIEPECVPWISTLWLESHPHRVTGTLQLRENYTHNFTNIITADLFGPSDRAQYANQYFSKVSTEFKEDQLKPLVIFKTESIGDVEQRDKLYIVRRGRSTYDNLSFEKSKAKFLSVEYTHPDLSVPIELELDSSWLFVGNELFTPSFVLRMLDYQPVMYFFDEEYVLKIMDDNCSIFTLKWDEYMLLTKDGYEIKTTEDSDSF